jgi:hypothetical protein
MIGLSTTIFKSAGKKLVNLFGSLASRSTYVENVTDSLSEKNHIDDLGVLDKATILLTPTATSDARVHSVKTYTGDELVTNETSKSVNTGGVYTDILTDINATLGQKLQVTYTLTGIEGDIQIWSYINYTAIYSPIHSTDGTYTATIDITGNNSSLDLRFYSPSGRTGTISNVSVVDVSSDFDFDRASSATRINSDGLVQDMQSITDPELVLNGDFEELGDNLVANGTFDLGDEEVTNGDFSNGSANWSTPTGWEIIDGKLKGTNVNAVSATQGSHTFLNKSFKVVYTVSDYARGDVRIYLGGTQQTPNRSANGTYTEYITITTANTTLYIQGINNFTGSIESISVKEVPYWTLGTNTTIENGKAILNVTSGGLQYITNVGLDILNTKTYKITFTANRTSGTGDLELGYSNGNRVTGTPIISTNGTQTIYFKPTYNTPNLGFKSYTTSGNYTWEINNVSVQQVDPNNRWSVTDSDEYNYVEFTEGFARLKFLNTSPITMLNSTLTLEQDKTYELVVDVYDVTSGSIKIDAAGLSELFNEEGVTTRYLKPTGNTTLSFYRATADVDITLASVSVKEVTFSDDVDLARINYDSNGENGHILLEPTSTNLIPYSEDFTDSSWDLDFSAPYITRTPNAATSPSGKNNATKLIGNNTSRDPNNSYVGVFTSASAPYTSSIFAKKGEYDYLVLGIGSYGGGYYAIFNLSNGTVSTSPTASGTTASIEDYGNGWHRCAITTTNTSGGELLFISPSVDGTLTTDYTSTTNGVYVWGAQLEALSYATSYIPTLTGSTVTRATETLTGSGNSTLINSTEGVLYAEIARSTVHNDYELLSISPTNNSDGTHYASLGYDNTDKKLWIRAKIGNTVAIASIGQVDIVLNQFYKIAIKYKSGENAIFVDGQKLIGTDITDGSETTTFTATPSTISDLEFRHWDANNSFYGKCKALAVFNEALSDDELELLTGVTNYGSFGELASANGYTII